MKTVLMVAFHFPPLSGTSGILRTLHFARHLPRFGWTPIVLTAHPMAYAQTDPRSLSMIPPALIVERAFAFDGARHFSLLGRYPACFARPDRFASWRFDALRRARTLIAHHQPSLLWSSFPISSAHQIGAALCRRFKLPWVADFRDPMAQPGYPSDPKTFAAWLRIEKTALTESAAAVFVAPGAKRFYEARYPAAARPRWRVIENGFDEESFPPPANRGALEGTHLTLLHSGVIYPSERDPRPLFEALATLDTRTLPAFRLRFRASGHDAWLKGLIARYGIEDLIELAPSISHTEALIEMQAADGLVVIQAKNCNEQIPAKLYEYCRAHRPILGLVDREGDTAQCLREAFPGTPQLCNPDDAPAIAAALRSFLLALKNQSAHLPDPHWVRQASRAERTRSLARLFDEIVEGT
jgi:hypothetical protein